MDFGFFKRTEFACKCGCGFAAVDAELLAVLTQIREHFGAPVIINSGCRCVRNNRKAGGAPDSYHVKGMAADIKIRGIAPISIHDFLERLYPGRFGLGLYKDWVHIDVREEMARWQR